MQFDIDLPDAIVADIDTMARREYGTRESVIVRLLARGVDNEFKTWPFAYEHMRAPDGPGDHVQPNLYPVLDPLIDGLSCAVCGASLIACGCAAQELRRLLARSAPVAHVGRVSTGPTDAHPPPEEPTLPRRRARRIPPLPEFSMSMPPDNVPAHVLAITDDPDAVLRQANLRLREHRIAQGLDPDTGCAPVAAGVNAHASHDVGASEDDT